MSIRWCDEAAGGCHYALRLRARRASADRRHAAAARTGWSAFYREHAQAAIVGSIGRAARRSACRFGPAPTARAACWSCRWSPASASSARCTSRTTSATTPSATAEVRLLHDGGREHGRGARERAPVRRDAAPAEGNRAAQRRAGRDQQHPAGHGRGARLPGDRRPGRRQAARGASTPATSASAGGDEAAASWCTRSTSTSTASACIVPPRPAAARRPGRTHRCRRAALVVGTRRGAEPHRLRRAFAGTDRWRNAGVGVPIIGSDRVLGAIMLENYEREHAFGDAEVRLLPTVAASMGVALENARLFDETQRHARESSALSDVGRDLSSSLDLATVMDRIAGHAKDLLQANNSAIFLPDADGAHAPRHRRRRRRRRGDPRDRRRRPASASSAACSQSGRPELINDTAPTRARCRFAGTEQPQRRAADGGAAARRRRRCRGRWRSGATAASRSRRTSWSSWSACRAGHGGDAERAAVRRGAGGAGRRPRPRTRPRAPSWPP